ncbi:MAG: hypothetical protein QM755_03210 [Luteolibacter sp.]
MNILNTPNHLRLAAVATIVFPMTCHAQVLTEDYENYTPGTGTYSGAWQFAYADADMVSHGVIPSRTVSSLNIGTDDPSPVGGNYLSFQTTTSTWAGNLRY